MAGAGHDSRVVVQLSKIACKALDENDADAPAAAPDGTVEADQATPEDGGEILIDGASCLGNQLTRIVVTQVMPAVLVILWQNAIMPLTLYSIALFEKAQMSFSRLDRRILMLFFWWDMFNVFFGAIISGSIVNLVQRCWARPCGNPPTSSSTTSRCAPLAWCRSGSSSSMAASGAGYSSAPLPPLLTCPCHLAVLSDVRHEQQTAGESSTPTLS